MMAFVLMVVGFWTYAKIAGAPNLSVGLTSVYFADNGEPIGETSNGQKRLWVKLDEISPKFIDAIVTIEDQNFFEHSGIDIKRIGGALLADLKAGKKVQGASTISQQYARTLFLSQEKTWNRKIQEALYALRIEANYTKREILEGYLNTIYFGHGMYGIEAASEFYFHKSAKELDLAEATILAGIPKGPGIFSPLPSDKNAKTRQKIILSELVKVGKIKKADSVAAFAQPLHYYGTGLTVKESIAPYFQDEVKKEVIRILADRKDLLEHGGLRIYTTLNLDNQRAAEQVVKETIPTQSEVQVALITMEPQTGEVKAMLGGRDYAVSPFNRATQSLRQPGSTIKPLLYYAALENGFTPSTTMRSEETQFTYDHGRAIYAPHNFNSHYANKEITMAQALAISDNIYAVKTHLFLGEEKLVNTSKLFGISSEFNQVPSLALGTSIVRPIEMTNAFNYFANSGKKVSPTYVEKITNYKGDVLYEKKDTTEQVLDSARAFVMGQMMKGIFDASLNGYANVTGSSIISKLTHDYAAKSGTTETDSWMIGFTPELTTGIWIGYDTEKKLELWTEQKFAKSIWAAVMDKELAAIPVSEMTVPEDVIGVTVDPETGLLANEDCPASRLTYFTKGTEPVESCYLHNHTEKKDTKKKTKKKPKKKEPWYKKLF